MRKYYFFETNKELIIIKEQNNKLYLLNGRYAKFRESNFKTIQGFDLQHYMAEFELVFEIETNHGVKEIIETYIPQYLL